jgi:uncharacterized protein YbjT (DUF2867 family)
MRIVILGGTGLIGSKAAARLRGKGHDVVAASPSTGVDTLSGRGLAEALLGADAVVDVTNSPSFADDAVMAFFRTSTRNILSAAASAGVRRLVALSVVGADRLADSGYMRAKVAQESLIRAGAVPCTIVRATQFFEFLGALADSATIGGTIRLPTALMQPIAAADVSDVVADTALDAPTGGVFDIAGPEKMPMHELVARYLTHRGDGRSVVADNAALYFGAHLENDALVPIGPARLAPTRLESWLGQSGERRAG